jgi:glycosyltransferase involved in cell wall biosynthesis
MLSKPAHILLLCSRLDTPGGIERSVVNTANLFVTQGHKVTILVTDTDGMYKSHFKISDQIKVEWLSASFGITKKGNPFSRKYWLFRDIRALGRIFSKCQPDIIIASEYHLAITMVLSGAGKNAACYSWEHLHYNRQHSNRFWSFLKRKYYPRLTGIICLNETEAGFYRQFGHTFIVPNFIQPYTTAADVSRSGNILTVGWLAEHKGTDLIPEIAGKILQEYPDWTWTLVGDGPLKPAIKKFITETHLQERLLLVSPAEAELEKEYNKSALFVLLSRAEAFPMVLLEAMSHGVPAISFDCPSGPAHIIKHETDGLLVENKNTEAMLNAIRKLIMNAALRDRLAVAALQNIQRFSPEAIWEKWKPVLNPSGTF